MAITELKLSKDQPNIAIDGQETVAAEKWILILDEPTKPIAVGLILRSNLSSYGFPTIGESNSIDPSLIAVSYQAKQAIAETYTQYNITVNYSNSRERIDGAVAPADAQPTYTFSKVDNLVILEHEKAGARRAIQNSAKTPLAIEVNEPYMRLTIQRNESDYDHKVALENIGRVNKTSARILGKTFAPQTMMLEDWSGTTEYDNDGVLFWKVTYQIIFKDRVIVKSYEDGVKEVNGFTKIILDKGFYDISGKRATAENGSISGRELKLNGYGEFFDKEDQASDIAAYLLFDIYEESEWPKLIGFKDEPNPNNLVREGQSDGWLGGIGEGGTFLRE